MGEILRARLLSAATAGAIVRVIYNQGSQPGTVREIVPLAIVGDELQARDLTSRVDKTYKLEHMELAEPHTSAPHYDPSGPQNANNQSVRDALSPRLSELRLLGWHVELEENRISLHRFFKNGKLRKGCDVTMGFDEFVGNGLQEARRPSKRPYNVSSASFSTRTFQNLLPAIALFLEEARKLAPRT
jgi:hypothetical protein